MGLDGGGQAARAETAKCGGIQKGRLGCLDDRARRGDQLRGPVTNWLARAELLGFFVPGVRSRNLTPFTYAVPVLGLRNGPDLGTVFVTDRARIFVSVSANLEAGLGVGGMDWGGVGGGVVR